MSETFPQDTPIVRASIADLDPDQLVEYIAKLQERRLSAYRIYEAGMRAKQDAKDAKTAASLDKLLVRMKKNFDKIEVMLETLEKQSIEVQAYRLALGDLT